MKDNISCPLLDRNSRGAVALQKRVDLSIVPFKLELLAKLFADGGLDSLEDVLEHAKVGRVVLVVVAALENTGADKACVPSVKVLQNIC